VKGVPRTKIFFLDTRKMLEGGQGGYQKEDQKEDFMKGKRTNFQEDTTSLQSVVVGRERSAQNAHRS